MLAEERQQIIMKQLTDRHVVKLQDLVSLMHASESTVRRDLQELEGRHLLRRVHGGALLVRPRNDEPDMATKTARNIQKKKAIAKFAASLVKDKECIYLDAGTTTLEVIPFLKDKHVTVVTNGPKHGEMLAEQNTVCYLIGGKVKRSTKAVIGSIAVQTLNLFRFDKAFVGVNGIDTEMGFTTPDPEEAMLKKHASELAEQTYVLADSSKFSEISSCKIIDLNQADVITDSLPDTAGSSISEITRVYCCS
ncbi:DeoR/GlpR family DNA-binding transcription regulator [Sporolactobacillus sp. Y61]|uniref:DeoR/GlpR family DNA-binding transcription regulator n=1 Tax=Sporolactobacillus sp. Y61 TaxID=3160863 RepID=A0AAU8ICM2_9BACL